MEYEALRDGIFLRRPNRFVAHVMIDGTEQICHVKNTGRLRELLVPGARVRCQHHDNPGRKTQWSLILVERAGQWVCIDSQMPNALARQWLEDGGLGERPEWIRPEYSFGDSRIDLAFSLAGRSALMEVKGVTLLQDGVARFPDAPTQRGIRHLRELGRAAREGMAAYVLFVIQMQGARCFAPNRANGPEFAEALRQAAADGVQVLAVDCAVTERGITVAGRVPVELER